MRFNYWAEKLRAYSRSLAEHKNSDIPRDLITSIGKDVEPYRKKQYGSSLRIAELNEIGMKLGDMIHSVRMMNPMDFVRFGFHEEAVNEAVFPLESAMFEKEFPFAAGLLRITGKA